MDDTTIMCIKEAEIRLGRVRKEREYEVKRGIKGLDPKGRGEMGENAIKAQYKKL